MEPPPPSLEAMVRSARTEDVQGRRGGWLIWAVLLLLAAVVTAYVAR